MPILLIEDNRIVARIVCQILKDQQYEVDHVPSAEAAFGKTHENDYNLMIIDWMLPGVNGVDFVRLLRSHPLFQDVPILMFTHRDRDVDVVEAVQAEVDGYVRKPSKKWGGDTTDTLLAKVSQLYRYDPAPESPSAEA